MGKKKQRTKQVSKGERRSVSKKITNAARRDYIASDGMERLINQLDAYKKNKNVVVTIPNPNKKETNKPSIKVNGRDYFRQVSR